MSNFKGTKVKWRVDSKLANKGKYAAYELDIDFSENLVQCVTVYCEDEIPTETEYANALLISKAPELLEAIEEFIRVNSEIGVLNVDYFDAKFKQLIKEATEL